MKKLVLALSTVLAVAVLVWAVAAQPGQPAPAERSAHLLDRGDAEVPAGPNRGGTSPPTGPTPIFFPPASPGAVPIPAGAGALGTVVFGPGFGGLLGNLFLPGAGYPASYLTAGVVPGFDITGVYAWHLAPAPTASTVRIVGAAAAPPPPTATPIAPAGPLGPPPAFASGPVGPPGPAMSGLVSAPGLFVPPVRVTPGSSAVFCGLGVGGPGFAPFGVGTMGPGNGLGGFPGAQPPLRTAMFPMMPGAVIPTIFVPPGAAYIVGCFADSSTTPVELMAFGIE